MPGSCKYRFDGTMWTLLEGCAVAKGACTLANHQLGQPVNNNPFQVKGSGSAISRTVRFNGATFEFRDSLLNANPDLSIVEMRTGFENRPAPAPGDPAVPDPDGPRVPHSGMGINCKFTALAAGYLVRIKCT